MSKSVLDLIEIAETFTEGDSITDLNGLMWTNEFLQHKLGADAFIRLTQDYTNSVAGTEYDLPITLERVHKVDRFRASDMVDKMERYKAFVIDYPKVIFEDDGHFKLHYMVLPTELTDVEDMVEVDPVFYLPCELWIAYRHLTNDDEDNAAPNTLGQLRLQEFYVALNNSVIQRRKKFSLAYRIRRG